MVMATEPKTEVKRTIIAMSMNYWGRGDTIEAAMKQLKAAGGTTAKGKMLLINAPPDARIDDMGGTCWRDPNDEHERPYYIGRDGKRLADQAEPLV